MISILSDEKEILSILRQTIHPSTKDMLCFFSSQLNAFVTDPVFMNVSIQDKMIHRGYSVFDTTKIFGNKIYQLEKHLDRFVESTRKIYLKPKFTRSELKTILTQMATLARKINPTDDIDLRYFYSAGVGNFVLKVENESNTFFAVAVKANNAARPTNGVNEITVNVDKLRSELYSVKSTNYLVNCIVVRKAQMEESFMGIFTDEEGHLLESPTNNIAFLLHDKTFVVPPFEKTLVGTTIIRCFDHITENLITKGIIKEIRREYLTIEDVKKYASEVMLVGGDFIVPVLKINDLKISDVPGEITRLLQSFLLNDKSGTENEVCEDIPAFVEKEFMV